MRKEEKQFLIEYLELCKKHNLQIGANNDCIIICKFYNDYIDLLHLIEDPLPKGEQYDYNQDQLEYIYNKIKL